MHRTVYAAAIAAVLASLTLGQTYVNGPLVTAVGGGFSGADLSVLEPNSNTLGWNCTGSAAANGRLADDFTVPCGESWALGAIRVYGYQTQPAAGPFTTTSTLVGANYRIWNGQPGTVGASVIHDFSSTSQMTATGFTNIYRAANATPLNAQRPIFSATMAGNTIVLGAGTYWLDWQLNGSSVNGSFACFTPPITILGQPNTGNAVGFAGLFVPPNPAGTWNNALLDVDPTAAGTVYVKGMPFEIDYVLGATGCWTYDITQPSGPGTGIFLTNAGGTPGNTYVNIVTLVQNNWPNGWLYGVDVSASELTGLLNGGPLFSGPIPPSGVVSFGPFPGALLPQPLTVYYVGLELAGSVVANVDATKSVVISP